MYQGFEPCPCARHCTTGTRPTAAAWSSSPAGTCRCSTRTIVEEHNGRAHRGRPVRHQPHGPAAPSAAPMRLALIQRVYTNNAATMKDGQVRYGLVCNDTGRHPRRRAGLSLARRLCHGRQRLQPRRRSSAGWPSTRAAVTFRSMDQTTEHLHDRRARAQGAWQLCRGLGPKSMPAAGLLLCRPTRYRRQDCVVSRTGYTGEDGLEFIVPAARACSCGKNLFAAGPSHAAWERATRCGSKPPCRSTATS